LLQVPAAATTYGPQPWMIFFDPDAARIHSSGLTVADNVAALMNATRGITYVIIGHTDARGQAAHNRRLSCQRAFAVRDYLVSRGNPRERLTVFGRGEDEPLEGIHPDSAEQRRVEVYFVTEENPEAWSSGAFRC
jgi:outer membrane protein OmpA-like peptidoglycan-associated protein